MGIIVHKSLSTLLPAKGLTYLRNVLNEQYEVNKRYMEKLQSTRDINIIPKVDPIIDYIRVSSYSNFNSTTNDSILPFAKAIYYDSGIPLNFVNFDEVRHLMSDWERETMDMMPPVLFHRFRDINMCDEFHKHELLDELSNLRGYKSKYWFPLSYFSLVNDEPLKSIPKVTLYHKSINVFPLMHARNPGRILYTPTIVMPSVIAGDISKYPFLAPKPDEELRSTFYQHQCKHKYRSCAYYISQKSNNPKTDIPMKKFRNSYSFTNIKRTYYNIEHIRKPMPENIVTKIKEYLANAQSHDSSSEVDKSNPSLLSSSSSIGSLCIDGFTGEDLSSITPLYNTNFKNKIFFNVEELLKNNMQIFPNSLPIRVELNRDNEMFYYTNIDESRTLSPENLFLFCWRSGVWDL